MPPWALKPSRRRAPSRPRGRLHDPALVAATVGSVPLPWTEGVRVARIIGNFEQPGMNVAATFTYTTADQASTAADGIRTETGWLKLLGPLLGGLSLQNLDVTAEGKDMKCKFALDDASLGHLLAMVAQLLPAAP